MSKTKLISPGIPNYTLKRNLKLNGKYLSNDGGDEGIRIDDDGKVGIAESSPASQLEVAGEGALRITNTDQDAAWGGWVIKQHTDAFLNISYPGSSDNVITANYSNGRVAECILAIAEGEFNEVNVVDKEICFMSTLIKIMRIIK